MPNKLCGCSQKDGQSPGLEKVSKWKSLEVVIGSLAASDIKNMTLDDLNNIQFKFTFAGKPESMPNVSMAGLRRNSSIKLNVETIDFPECIPGDVCEKIRGLFYNATEPKLIPISLWALKGSIKWSQHMNEKLDVSKIIAFFVQNARNSFANNVPGINLVARIPLVM